MNTRNQSKFKIAEMILKIVGSRQDLPAGEQQCLAANLLSIYKQLHDHMTDGDSWVYLD